MSSITLHNLEDTLYAMLKKKAREERKSMNRTIQELLAESMGLKKKSARTRNRKDEYAELCGAMSREELRRMEDTEREFEVIDESDWK